MQNTVSHLTKIFAVAVALLAFGGCGGGGNPQAAKEIVGSWSLVDGGFELINEYRADGTIVQIIDGRRGPPFDYEIDGEYVIVSVKQPNGKLNPQKDKFRLEGDTLTFIDETDGEERVFERVKQ